GGGETMCRVFAIAWTEENIVADNPEPSFGAVEGWWDADANVYSYHSAPPGPETFEVSTLYDGEDAFIAEGAAVGLVTARSRVANDFVGGIRNQFTYRRDEGRLVEVDLHVDDYFVADETTIYSEHDELGRPLEGQSDRLEVDLITSRCEGIRTTFAYDDEARTITESVSRGTNPDTQQPCGRTYVIVTEHDDDGIAIRDRWWFDVGEPTGEPFMTNTVDVEETDRVCVDTTAART
ncbi:MAG TPA: hypothetical protein VKB80_08410, partial [Kofleriaceae bacterium]|nr:hypothetical protein [Kofleriaceae bacterium]